MKIYTVFAFKGGDNMSEIEIMTKFVVAWLAVLCIVLSVVYPDEVLLDIIFFYSVLIIITLLLVGCLVRSLFF